MNDEPKLGAHERWRAIPEKNGYGIFDDNGNRIATVMTSVTISRKRAEMYANLIAAAPDLLRNLPERRYE